MAGLVMIAANWLSTSDALILAAVILASIKWVADYRGWTRSPALVRQENADLRERNATLQAEVTRLDAADRENRERIAALEAQVSELQSRDQRAVLDAIAAHEESVAAMWRDNRSYSERHEQAAESRNQQAADRHRESVAVLRDIRDNLTNHEGG